jgi:hypothetical protein
MLDDRTPPDISEELRARIESIAAKRPRTVLDHILEYGYITTDELKQTYGYNHPPRASRDVRERGIELETFKVTGPDGRKIAAYRFPAEEVVGGRISGGRRSFPKKFKQLLLERDGEQCRICEGKFPGNILQIDHKVPYEIGGDTEGSLNPDEFMLLCRSCNRAKSWTCEHCDNWKTIKNAAVCTSCLFGSPNRYEHIAMKQMRRLTLVWEGKDVQDYDSLEKEGSERGQHIRAYIKGILKARKQPPLAEGTDQA